MKDGPLPSGKVLHFPINIFSRTLCTLLEGMRAGDVAYSAAPLGPEPGWAGGAKKNLRENNYSRLLYGVINLIPSRKLANSI